MSSIAVYGVMLAGWSSGSKYPLLGSVRASAQMVSYEAALGLSVVAVVLLAGSLSTHDIVMTQAGDGFGGIIPRLERRRHRASCPFVIFLIAGTAELNRPPFDLVEAEQELVGGFHTEYSLDPLRAVLPRRVHEHDHDVGDHRHAVPRRPGRARRSSGPDWIWGPIWFLAKLFVLPVHVRVVPGHAAPVPLRPADGPRLEGAHPAGARLAAPARQPSTSPATRTGTPASSSAVGFVAVVVVATCSSPPPCARPRSAAASSTDEEVFA